MKPLSILSTVTALTALAAFADPALAQDAAATTAAAEPAGSGTLSPEAQYIFNTFLFLTMGFLVMWMAAGFAMLEAGLVRSKNVSMQLLKNIALYAIAGIMYWVVGYALMYTDVAANGGWFGTPMPYSWPAAGKGSIADGSYSVPSDWFFQMVFCATTASIVSGTLAERIKLWPFLIFTVLLTGIIYPLAGSWKWGAGWLDQMGFQDFAGSTLVHSVGGWAALAGALILGARSGKYGSNGEVNALPGSSMPLATLGTFILWLGWFGFNGGSQLALGTAADAADVSRIFANTNLAAAGGVVVAIILTQILYGKVDITMALNGALAGLVSITAEPLTPSPLMSIIIGGVGGVIVVFAVPLLDKLKIDDVVGAIPVHLMAGIWGTIAVPITNSDASFSVQAIGIVAYAVFAFCVSFVAWIILKMVIGIRVSAEEEYAGLDKAEIGVEAYPEFGTGSQRV